MNWTKTPPEKPGYYWHKWDPLPEPDIVCLTMQADGMWMDLFGEEYSMRLTDHNPPGSQWAGPILPPGEAQV